MKDEHANIDMECRNCGKMFGDYRRFKEHIRACRENRVTIGDIAEVRED